MMCDYNQNMKPANISKQRIMGQLRKLQAEKLPYLHAAPLQYDLYNWHFTFQGPENTEFHEGIYHGQILLPYQYPFKPPDIVFMNKNGRFQTNTKICLTITQYHPEEWNSAWTIRTMLEAVISLFAENVHGVGALNSTPDVRAFLAKSSHSYVCEKCGPIEALLKPRPPISESKAIEKAKEEVKMAEEEMKLVQKLRRNVTEGERQNVSISQLASPINRIQPKKSLFKQNLPAKVKRIESILQKESRIVEKQERDQQVEQMSEPKESSDGQSVLKESRVRQQKIVYIKERLPLPSNITNLSKTIKTIQSNLKKLEHVSASMRWVD